MNFLTNTIVEYIIRTATGNKVYRYVLPSYPASVLLQVGLELKEQFSRMLSVRRVTLVYGVAYRLGKQWQGSGSQEDRKTFDRICEEGWYNHDDNLTALRNRLLRPEKEDTLVTLFAGYDQISDQASLKDFFHLDQDDIWKLCLKRSFTPWVQSKLQLVLDPADAGVYIESMASVLAALYEQGLADLAGISDYLQALDLTDVSTGRDAYKLLLGSLGTFNLPPMQSLAYQGAKKSFASYIGPAQRFFNYGEFLDESARKKALKRIDCFEKKEGTKELDPAMLGAFGTVAELLASTRRYITERSSADREKLLTVDFPLVHRIINHRPIINHKKPKVKKLDGLPPEVFLRALWLTLRDYVKEARGNSLLPLESLQGITLKSVLFKHDFDSGEDGPAGVVADTELAREFLRKTLGGIDDLLKRHVHLSGSETADGAGFHSKLCPDANGDDVRYQKSATAEPSLQFEVAVTWGNERKSTRREFLWKLPENHQSRLLADMYRWALDGFKNSGNALPAFATPYMAEIFLSRDEEEVNRLVGLAIGHQDRQFADLLQAAGLDVHDPLMSKVQKLSILYQQFLRQYEDHGFFSALEDRLTDLRKEYTDLCKAFLEKNKESCMGPLLFKAFALVDTKTAGAEGWRWQQYMEYAIATPLHPAVLDMIRQQHAFLGESFTIYANEALREPTGKQLAERNWSRLADLARMDRPLFGTLKDAALALDSNVRSYGYLHLIGDCHEKSSGIDSKLLRDYDAEDEDDIEDAELFSSSRASELVRNTLEDYWDLHPHADDGLSIGAYCGREIQPVIAGIDSFLAKVLSGRSERPYGLQVTVFSSGRDDSAVTRWLNAWRNRWQEAELSQSRSYYGNCRISISYRVVSEDGDRGELAKLLRSTPLDVVFLTDFIRAGASHFVVLPEEDAESNDYRQFPVLEKACCAVIGGGTAEQRERVLSHRRFAVASLHAEVMARLVNSDLEPQKRHAIVGRSDFQPWKTVVDAAHSNSAWVVCIDPSVDELLLRKKTLGGASSREIIGFGTGVGSHGENNYTVSTEQFSMVDIGKRISQQVSAVLGPWDLATRESVARELVAEASHLAGLSVVRALGPSQYVRDYIAYATVRKLLRTTTQAFCDEVISLDAFTHWFEDADRRIRPDLLRLRARIVEGYFEIDAQVLECKLARYSYDYILEAQRQVAAGLKQLFSCFQPREEGRPLGLADRPDQRYWWMQLHRLIASRGRTTMPHYSQALAALERLSEGFFTISWQGAVIAFWTDVAQDGLRLEDTSTVDLEGDELTVQAFGASGEMIRKACLEGVSVDIFDSAKPLVRSFKRAKRVEPVETITNASSGSGSSVETSEQAPQATGPVDHVSVDIGPDPNGAGGGHPTQVDAGGQDPPGDGEAKTSGEQQAIEVTAGVAQRILLGTVVPSGRSVYWEYNHDELPNRHLLVFGASGTGKTYTIQALLCELAKAGQNSLIVDYTSGFTDAQMEAPARKMLQPQQHIIRIEPLPINPFRRQVDLIGGFELEESPAITAQRVSGVFDEIYQLGPQQKNALYKAISDGISKRGSQFSLAGLLEQLEEMQEAGGAVGNASATAKTKIQPFVDMNPFGQEDLESWEKLFNDAKSRSHIIQLAGFSKDMAKLITEFALIDLYRYYRTKGSKDKPRVIVLDEIQNLDHRLDSPLAQFLTEGRKFGISLILATQTLSNLEKDERDRLFQASHTLFFRPAVTELKSFAQILADVTGERADDWVTRLAALKKGECYSLGPALKEGTRLLEPRRYFKIQITALPERLRIGTTTVQLP